MSSDFLIKTITYSSGLLSVTITTECHLHEIASIVKCLDDALAAERQQEATEVPEETAPAEVPEQEAQEAVTVGERDVELPVVDEVPEHVELEDAPSVNVGKIEHYNGVLVYSRREGPKGNILVLANGTEVLEGTTKSRPVDAGPLAAARYAHSNRWKKMDPWYDGRAVVDVSNISDWRVVLTLEDGVRLVIGEEDEVLETTSAQKRAGLDPAKAMAAYEAKDNAAEEPSKPSTPPGGDYLLEEAKKAPTLHDVVKLVAEELGPDGEVVADWCMENRADVPALAKVSAARLAKRVVRLVQSA